MAPAMDAPHRVRRRRAHPSNQSCAGHTLQTSPEIASRDRGAGRLSRARVFKPSFARDGLEVYEGSFELRAKLPRGRFGEGDALRAELRVQACNDEICLPPDTLFIVVGRQP